MASNMRLPIFVTFLLLPAFAVGKEFVVGDGMGWTTNIDYQAWAKGKEFQVGDTLVFNYPKGVHNVFGVDGPTFKSCVAPKNGAHESGNDVITLATPGRKWYICGVGKHCELGGQKLAITVEAGAPAPAPSSPAPEAPTSNSASMRFATGSQVVAIMTVFLTSLVMFRA